MPTIAVIGSGAVGLYYGGRLAQHNHSVHFLLRSDYERIASQGLHVRSCDGDFTLPPSTFHAHRSTDTMPPADIILIALKTTSNHFFEPLIRPLLKPNTCLITLQNGLGNEDTLHSLFPSHSILGGMAFTCINRQPNASIHHSSHGLIRLGHFSPSAATPHTPEIIASLFTSSKIRCEPIPDLIKGRWQKLIWNVPFNGLGAALDLATDQLLASPQGAELASKLMHEIMAASAALGMPFPNPDEIVRHQLATTRDMARYQTSMQLDRRNNRELEIEAIIGQPLQRGRAASVSMPQTALLYNLLSIVNTTLTKI
ncbi:MAG TPA: 2-dehydropantoate 2-reductase [Tepidisphaeraceae bacterium]|jgi:2-dehydropantoate 2-reductase|nr:2-dehydropantoate 2-reductase [Tepidisphaeraceae bacterium]